MDICNNHLNEEDLLRQIMACDFAIDELVLYLDTHPKSEKATKLWQDYCNKCKNLKDTYQKLYGPLTSDFPCSKFCWVESPWPWERRL